MVYPQFIHTGFREASVAHPEESGKQKMTFGVLVDVAKGARKFADDNPQVRG
jgi:hypothetical protein